MIGFLSLLRPVFWGLIGLYVGVLHAKPSSDVEMKSLQGAQAKPYQETLSNFYNAVYQDPPYRYFARKEAWDAYVASYVDNAASIISLAFKGDKLIGAAMGMPLKDASEKYRAAFMNRPSDLKALVYLGELAVKEEYRSLGVGNSLYADFERVVRQRKGFLGICIWQLASESNSSEAVFWKNNGFKLQPEIHFEEMWREGSSPSAVKIPHEMVCWKKML